MRKAMPLRFIALLLAVLACNGAAMAQELRTYTGAKPFDDVKFELSNAIIGKGLVVENTGTIGAMLERTGPDVGSTRVLYKNAEFVTFCSAVLSRRMMEADPANIGYCPYVLFIYERADKPGETVVGYRRPPQNAADEASRKAFADIDALLDAIAREATQ